MVHMAQPRSQGPLSMEVLCYNGLKVSVSTKCRLQPADRVQTASLRKQPSFFAPGQVAFRETDVCDSPPKIPY